jgi:DNA-binding NtrC family response regulator
MTARFNQKFRKELFEIGPEILAALESYPWPGNIRQLENVIQHAVLVSSGQQLLLHHLPPATSQEHGTQSCPHGWGVAHTLRHSRELLERDVIQRALIISGHCLSRAADALGISRVTLHKKMKKHGLRASRRPPEGSHRPEG